MNWLDHPAVQGGIVPLVVALVVAAALARVGRGPAAWLAIVAGYVATTWLATGLDFEPLTAGRKIVLVAIVAPLVGLVLDAIGTRARWATLAIAVAAGAVSIWTFRSIVSQRETTAAVALALGLAVFAALQTALVAQSREDGLRTGAVGVGLGLATGAAAVLSASLGFLVAGVAVAAGAGALMLVQVLGRRPLPAGHAGALAVGLSCALFAEGAMLLAQMPWYALALMLVIPLGVRALDRPQLGLMARGSLLVGVAVVLAILPVAAAWYAARGGAT